MQNKFWQPLDPGDTVDVIMPAGRVSKENLAKLKELLLSWRLKVNIPEDIAGDDLLCAHSDEMRLKHLREALTRSQSKAVICARGGYGSMRLLPELFKLPAPAQTKLFVGMSDITALHIFLQQQWRWATLHASVAPWRLTEASLQQVKAVLLGETNAVSFNNLIAFNAEAEQQQLIHSTVVGGNLCLVQSSLGTPWQLDARNKIILLEEINERAYKVDRMLEQLYQAGIFAQARAVILGDFISGEEPDGASLIKPVLQRFAAKLPVPVIQIKGIGHGDNNQPIPLATAATLELGKQKQLNCQLNKLPFLKT